MVVQRQLDALTRPNGVQAGAFHVPGDRPRRLVIINQESLTELGQNFLRSRRNEGSVRLGC